MLGITKSELKELKKLGKKYDLRVLVLFGSRAKGTHKKDSDYDIAFYPKKNFTTKDEINLFNEILGIINSDKVDLINLEKPKNYLLVKNIFFEGYCLFEHNDGLFNKMRGDSWFMYNDFKKYYDEEPELLRRRLEVL